jgi:hypothetical protein
MDNDLNKVLAELAAKLGVRSDHLYARCCGRLFLPGFGT